ncbi:MAG: glutamate formimidoyltransferase [Elusimicrobiota bacterium]
MKLVECVPNFSEGQDKSVIEAITAAIRSVAGVRVLDVDPGAATNRTVYTFAGSPDTVLEAAFAAIAKGAELIDMRRHKGEHARQGACDVCPFVPIADVTMAECVDLAKRLGERVGRELKIPVYLYAEAAQRPERRRMPDIRVGEYEALEEKLKEPQWAPDYGPAEFNARSGATVIGARNFLIAYNINLNTRSVNIAKRIANRVREKGGNQRGPDGKFVRDAAGNPLQEPGMFKSVQGTGWLIPEYNRAQITVNILDIDASPVHKVYDACCDLAAQLGCRVTGSEIVGMVPKRVMVEAGRYFLKKQGVSTGVSEREIVRCAVQSFGLEDVAPFDPTQKIIEERFTDAMPLADMTLTGFIDELAADSPAPGGGSVAALSGALAASLASMVAALTHGKRIYEQVWDDMEKLGVTAQKLKDLQLAAIDADTAAFDAVMAAMRLPKETPAQKKERAAALLAATKTATLVPLQTLERTIPTLELAALAAEKGNPNSLSDAGVAALMARAAAYGAYYNVLINLPGIDDEKWRRLTRTKAEALVEEARDLADGVERTILERLGK